MFLSKLTLDPRDPKARRDLADAYEMHRTLARAFAPDEQTPPAQFLWRLEPRTDYRPSTVVLVQSEQPADWSFLNANPAYHIEGNKAFDLQTFIQPSARYRFRLLANPTVTRLGKRYGLTGEEAQKAWLTRQGERYGFSVLGCVRLAEGRLQVRQSRTGHRITLHTVLFEGLLQVESADALRLGVRNGLGHGKAFGLGLLSLARVKE
ncbi:type I-E CRISPR-associated protein Cas6/Cse3/CasE [Hydrogenophilus islandicus]